MKKIIIISLSAALAGCVFEPTQEEVESAVRAGFAEDYKPFLESKLGGTVAALAGIEGVKVFSVEKLGCVESSKKAFTCEVLVEYWIVAKAGGFAQLLGADGKQKSVEKYRLLKTSRGWTALSLAS